MVKDHIKYEDVEVKGELVVHDINLQELEDKFKGFFENTKTLRNDVILLEGVNQRMDLAFDDIEAEFKKIKNLYNSRKKEIQRVLDIYKEKVIEEGLKNKTETEKFKKKVDAETGEVFTTREVKVDWKTPKGVTIKRSPIKWAYNEELIPDEYFKKELKKSEVKKAVQAGKLPDNVVTLTEGSLSVIIDSLKIEQGILEEKAKLEAKGAKNE